MPFPAYDDGLDYFQQPPVAGPSTTPMEYLSPGHASRARLSRTTSFASNASSARSISQSDVGSRSTSPNTAEMAKWGARNEDGSWSCSYPGCVSRSTFTRGCDLRKHYKRHTKSLFCRAEGCPQATEGSFSSKKDRARHEAKHNPTIMCEWDGCGRLFSRNDNMKDHVRRVHQRRIT
ncbi:Trichothecene biosynthesis transcription regulator TRI6 [Fulvia fulva]|uniref:Trichothecene biosynthesis transcription regulator TRI6 n=1 Tax=Passalora fulva TaxID=5499 RepID=A0A9Q8UV63_PASFU|nr:Trichothecene biosynthesis transcription regulator TRI6 [Fulvia fulva]KAK4613198.1 Trichothecene biosynthesis transcription regulator TRI6 [Fulvia fulva]UJO23664.1 Trichothecene biosynthesis transcription regulator TRI6 [Fulvia fulva]